jgi:hypothetical protein
VSELSFDELVIAGVGLFVLTALITLPIAIVIALALIRLYRHRVERSMRIGAGAPAKLSSPQPAAFPQNTLEIEFIAPDGVTPRVARAAPVVDKIGRQAWLVAAIIAGAASLQPLTSAAAILVAVNFNPSSKVVLKSVLLFGSFYLILATPVALAPTMVLKPRPRFLALAVMILIAALGASDAVIGGSSLELWLMLASVPTLAVLLLNARRLRAVGPIVFAAILLLLFGAGASAVYAAVDAWEAIGPLRFVRDDLSQLPIFDAFSRYFFDEIGRLPLPEMMAAINEFVRNPTSVVQAEHPEALTTAVKLRSVGILLAATGFGVAAALALPWWIARSYQARRASDAMLTIDIMMVIFTIAGFVTQLAAFGWVLAPAAPAGFAGYKLSVRWCLRRRRRSAPTAAPRTLLLLRVFGFDKRTQRLLDDLGQRWRYLGPIRLIGGADLAYATLEPHEFFAFLSGRLTRAFIKDLGDLNRRLVETTAVPDPDGLYRVEDFFCHNDTWRMTVSRLARDAHAVLMDLRGFTPANRGCIFEIEELVASVAVIRVVLIVDDSTDVAFLEQTIEGAWRAMPSDSPNAVEGPYRVRILKASSRHRRTLDTLLGLLCES